MHLLLSNIKEFPGEHAPEPPSGYVPSAHHEAHPLLSQILDPPPSLGSMVHQIGASCTQLENTGRHHGCVDYVTHSIRPGIHILHPRWYDEGAVQTFGKW